MKALPPQTARSRSRSGKAHANGVAAGVVDAAVVIALPSAAATRMQAESGEIASDPRKPQRKSVASRVVKAGLSPATRDRNPATSGRSPGTKAGRKQDLSRIVLSRS